MRSAGQVLHDPPDPTNPGRRRKHRQAVPILHSAENEGEAVHQFLQDSPVRDLPLDDLDVALPLPPPPVPGEAVPEPLDEDAVTPLAPFAAFGLLLAQRKRFTAGGVPFLPMAVGLLLLAGVLPAGCASAPPIQPDSVSITLVRRDPPAYYLAFRARGAMLPLAADLLDQKAIEEAPRLRCKVQGTQLDTAAEAPEAAKPDKKPEGKGEEGEAKEAPPETSTTIRGWLLCEGPGPGLSRGEIPRRRRGGLSSARAALGGRVQAHGIQVAVAGHVLPVRGGEVVRAAHGRIGLRAPRGLDRLLLTTIAGHEDGPFPAVPPVGPVLRESFLGLASVPSDGQTSLQDFRLLGFSRQGRRTGRLLPTGRGTADVLAQDLVDGVADAGGALRQLVEPGAQVHIDAQGHRLAGRLPRMTASWCGFGGHGSAYHGAATVAAGVDHAA